MFHLQKTTVSLLRSISWFLIFTQLLVSKWSLANDIRPDGSTATAVARNDAGKVQVEIAPANKDRTSYNRYSHFNVTKEGVSLNNTEVAARTIVNEVVGGSISKIHGDIEVLGTRAHLVIANRNGLSIDGVNFINTADTILTTADISTIDRDLAPGVSQTNTLLNVEQGSIVIGEAGLSGAMTSLDLLAKKISIYGDVTNSNRGRRQQLRIFSGKSSAELDSSLSPANPTRTTAAIRPEESKSKEILFSIHNGATVHAGAIFVAVTAEGAGVRMDGNMLADRGGILLSANGDIGISGNMQAAAQIHLQGAGNVNLEQDLNQPSFNIQAGAGIDIESDGAFKIKGMQISAASAGGDDDMAVSINAKKGIDIESIDSDHLGIVFAAKGDLLLQTQGDLNNYNARVLGNGDVTIEAAGDVNNLLAFNDFEGRGELQRTESEGSRKWYTFFLKREKRVSVRADYGELKIDGEIPFIVADGQLNIQADGGINNIGGDLLSNGSSIELKSSYFRNEAIASGQLEYESRCTLGCDRWGSSNVQLNGGGIKAAANIHIQAGREFYNLGGTTLALGSNIITADSIVNEAITVPLVYSRPKGLSGFFDFGVANIFRQDQGGALIANMGILQLNSESPIKIIGGQLISGDSVITPAGQSIIRERINESPIDTEGFGFIGLTL